MRLLAIVVVLELKVVEMLSNKKWAWSYILQITRGRGTYPLIPWASERWLDCQRDSYKRPRRICQLRRRIFSYIKINNHIIKLVNGQQPPYGVIYSLGSIELETLKTYIKTNLANKFIRQSKSPAGAPTFSYPLWPKVGRIPLTVRLRFQ